MTLTIARVLAGAAAAILIVSGLRASGRDAFAAADLLLAGVLVVAVLLPARWAGPILASASAYALGVHAVALASGTGAGPAAGGIVLASLGVLAVLGRRSWLSRARN